MSIYLVVAKHANKSSDRASLTSLSGDWCTYAILRAFQSESTAIQWHSEDEFLGVSSLLDPIIDCKGYSEVVIDAGGAWKWVEWCVVCCNLAIV